MKPGSGRPRFWRHAARFLAVLGVALAGVAIVGDQTGFGWISGPAAIGAISAMLLAFATFTNLPAATAERDMGDHMPLPTRSADPD